MRGWSENDHPLIDRAKRKLSFEVCQLHALAAFNPGYTAGDHRVDIQCIGEYADICFHADSQTSFLAASSVLKHPFVLIAFLIVLFRLSMAFVV